MELRIEFSQRFKLKLTFISNECIFLFFIFFKQAVTKQIEYKSNKLNNRIKNIVQPKIRI